jgi:hypothetical protein
MRTQCALTLTTCDASPPVLFHKLNQALRKSSSKSSSFTRPIKQYIVGVAFLHAGLFVLHLLSRGTRAPASFGNATLDAKAEVGCAATATAVSTAQLVLVDLTAEAMVPTHRLRLRPRPRRKTSCWAR